MDHVVYLDAKANELDNLLNGSKCMIIRGAAGRKMPYGRVNVDDVLYFLNNTAEGLVRAKGIVSSVHNSDKMTKEESIALVEANQSKLKLTDKQYQRWAGKRYLVLIEVNQLEEIAPFQFDKSEYNNMDDWLPVKKIDSIKI